MKKLFVGLCMLIAVNCFAQQPGSLDNSFNNTGVYLYSAPGYNTGYACLADGGNKIIVGGSARGQGIDTGFALLLRLKDNGTLDSSFGKNGLVVYNAMHGEDNFILQMTKTSTGKIIACGYNKLHGTSYSLPMVFSFNADGSIDSTFGDHVCCYGFTIYGSDNNVVFQDVAVDTGGNIVLAGKNVVSILNSTGTNAYSNYRAIATGVGTIMSVQVQPDNKILLCGTNGNNSFLTRVTSPFLLDDNTFGTNGLVTISDSGKVVNFSVVKLLPNGKILAAGNAGTVATRDFIVMRFNSNGSVDSAFGLNGRVTTDFWGYIDAINDIKVQPDGKIIAVGRSNYVFALARYTPNGILDNTFAVQGKDTTVVPNVTSNDFNSVALLSDGRIAAVGTGSSSSQSAIVMLYKNDIVLCSAHYTLYPDSTTQHSWFALKQTTGNAPFSYLWHWGDGTTSNTEFPSHTYSAAGNYNICLTITDSLGCISNYCDSNNVYKTESVVTINVVNQLPTHTGIQSVIENPQFTIFPSPATDQLNITIDESLLNAQLNIYNATGALVRSTKLETLHSKLEIGNLATGVYIAGIKTVTGSQRVRWVKM